MENSSAKNDEGRKIRTSPEGWPRADGDSPARGDADGLLAVVAEMAAGAAHELNNPLTVISGRAQLMREKAPTLEERKVWQQIVEQSQRISDIISDLMQFASPLPARPEKIDLEKLVAEIISFFSSPNPPNATAVKFDKDIEAQARRIRADREQIKAVLTELIRNSIAAAEGSLDVLITAVAVAGGKQVLLEIRDNGRGMDAETLAGAFTPFFSSQTAGRRRGLGLPTAWRYVVNNQGRIRIESQPGEGTSVFVLLPADR